MPEGVGYANNKQSGIWRIILDWFKKKSKERKIELDASVKPRQIIMVKYLESKNRDFKKDNDLLKSIQELEEMEPGEMNNVEKGKLLSALREEYWYRQLER